jgi:hypothetical protein
VNPIETRSIALGGLTDGVRSSRAKKSLMCDVAKCGTKHQRKYKSRNNDNSKKYNKPCNKIGINI